MFLVPFLRGGVVVDEEKFSFNSYQSENIFQQCSVLSLGAGNWVWDFLKISISSEWIYVTFGFRNLGPLS